MKGVCPDSRDERILFDPKLAGNREGPSEVSSVSVGRPLKDWSAVMVLRRWGALNGQQNRKRKFE